jgi:hypothetical protein
MVKQFIRWLFITSSRAVPCQLAQSKYQQSKNKACEKKDLKTPDYWAFGSEIFKQK